MHSTTWRKDESQIPDQVRPGFTRRDDNRNGDGKFLPAPRSPLPAPRSPLPAEGPNAGRAAGRYAPLATGHWPLAPSLSPLATGHLPLAPSLVRTLASAQLRSDLRNPATGASGGGRIAATAVAYGVSGGLLAVSLGQALPGEAVFVAASFAFVLAAFGVVGSYDELMGRPKDNAWLTTLPATEGQHYGARLVGIGAYVGLMAVMVALPVAVRVAVTSGGAAGALVGALVAGGTVWTAAVSLASLWALTLALPQRLLRPAVSAARAVLVGALVVGYQWISRGVSASGAPWWPGTWFADALAGRASPGLAALVASVAVLGWAFAGAFPRRYFALLARLGAGEREAETDRRSRTLTAAERWLTPTGPERAAYGFAVAAFSDDRIVRGRLWPAALLPLGFAAFGYIAGGLGSLFVYGPASVFEIPETQFHLSVLVVLLFCAQSLVQTLQFSDHARAAWVFGTLPEANPLGLQMGAQQALVLRVLAPLHVLLAVVLAAQMAALDAAIHALFWFAVCTVTTRVAALAYRRPPFSRQSDAFGAGARFVPLAASIPAAVLAILVQIVAFASRPRAVAVCVGLVVLSDVVGRLAVWASRRRHARPVRA